MTVPQEVSKSPEHTSVSRECAPNPGVAGSILGRAGWSGRRLLPTPPQAIFILRGTVALIFMAHALVRLVNGSAPQFGAFLETRGYPWGLTLVLVISTYEIIGGVLLALGIRVKIVCAGLAFIVVMGIVIIHRHLGWFVGEHGTGGMEFSWLLVAALLVLATADRAGGSEPSESSTATGQAAGGAAMLESTARRRANQ